MIEVRNPYTRELLGTYPFATEVDVNRALVSAIRCLRSWRFSPLGERASLLRTARDRLASRQEEFALQICREVGKPIAMARGEVTRAIGVLDLCVAELTGRSGEWFSLDPRPGQPSGAATGATIGASSNSAQLGAPLSGVGLVTRVPRGVVLGITPFNFPLNLIIHKIGPAIAAGCPILLKPSPYAVGTARMVVDLFAGAPAGCDDGLVQLLILSDEMSSRLTQAPEIATVSFTGSAEVGWKIRTQASRKHVELELGGNAWVAILEDIEPRWISSLADRIARAAYGYAGQSCISVQNIAVAENHWPLFKKEMTRATEAFAFGDPENSDVLCGPLIAGKFVDRVSRSMQPFARNSVRSANRVGDSGDLLLAPSCLFFDGLGNGGETAPGAKGDLESPIVADEAFGPVAVARPVQGLADVIEFTNRSRYGLQTGIFTHRIDHALAAARDIETGGVVINDVPTTRYDFQPYGGVKESGQGREGPASTIEAYTEARFIALSPLA